MFFRQVLYRDLGCASYVLGDADEAVVVDPRWDIDVYLEIARTERLRILYVVDTHDHADHVSGRVRLARGTGARAYRAADPGEGLEGPADREHRDAQGREEREFREDRISPGHEICVGSLRLRALPTPGHRPEHLTFAVADLSRGSEPWLLLTGDSLLVGDLARPDLVSEATEGARMLHASLKPLLAIGDHVEIWPAHVGGSLCGGAGLSGKTSSTVGFERRHNPLLMLDEEAFVRDLTKTLPTRPPNIGQIVSLNRRTDCEGPTDPAQLSADRLRDLMRARVTVLDSRLPPEFDAGHLAGSLNLPVSSPGVGTRAGWALDPTEPIIIAAEDPGSARAMASALQAVGLWQIAGYVLAEQSAWERHGLPVAKADSWDLEQLAGGLRQHSVQLVDVRDASEWNTGHVPGSHHVPLHRLGPGRSVDLPDTHRTTAVACAAGIRAAFAASLLRRAGRRDVVRIAGGGVDDLRAHGIPLDAGAD